MFLTGTVNTFYIPGIEGSIAIFLVMVRASLSLTDKRVGAKSELI
jgi:hypothetical protein